MIILPENITIFTGREVFISEETDLKLPLLMSAAKTVGGQAVIEGVMMRAKDNLAIAVRRPDGEITVELRPWFSMTPAFMKKPFCAVFLFLWRRWLTGLKL